MGGLRLTSSVEGLLEKLPEESGISSGAVVDEVLASHPTYLDERIGWDVAEHGPSRGIGDHLDIAASRWDPERTPVLSGRHVVLALALDEGVGRRLLESGVVASLLGLWQPGLGTDEEPHRLVWDLLSDAGRAAAEDQPLLAGAMGAPEEWSAEVPDAVVALAWSPQGDRIAALTEAAVYEVRSGRPARLLDRLEAPPPSSESQPGFVSLAWSGDGIVALRLQDGAHLIRARDNATLAELPELPTPAAGILSADGTTALLAATDGTDRWRRGETSVERIGPGASAQAIAPDGRRALLDTGGNTIMVAGSPGESFPADQYGRLPDWPADASPMVRWGLARTGPCAVLSWGPNGAVANAGPSGGVILDQLPFPPLARLASGTEEVTALAADRGGTRLAVARGGSVGVWTVAPERTGSAVPSYDSDRAEGDDLLDADRDANALAALIASEELRPPLTVGLFGAWGSGKSFVLRRVERALDQLSAPGASSGYLRHVKVVPFNAWHYAEEDLWASLVDQVLRAIGPVDEPELPPEAKAAQEAAEKAARRRDDLGSEVEDATKALGIAQEDLARRRRIAWYAGAALLFILGAAVIAGVLLGPSRVVAGTAAAIALLASAVGALHQARTAGAQARELAEAGRAGVGAVGRIMGRPEQVALGAAAARLGRAERERQEAGAEAARLAGEATRLRELADDEPLDVLLHRLAEVTEYRERLSLVARTRERFSRIDDAVRSSRAGGGDDGTPKAGRNAIERVVVTIDDLDRCAPEKVVSVLEAVHLLFDFELFVVLLAVDTRWLDQSLRIRYRHLLGDADTAEPSDYLEKIIQVPLHLRPLDESRVRDMIAGLTGAAPGTMSGSEPGTDGTAGDGATPAGEAGEARPTAPSQAVPADATLHASTPRVPRSPLPPDVMRISPRESRALTDVAPLVGSTPRTVKRFVNTYRLLKARSPDPHAFAEPGDPLGEHEVVAFLLATMTGSATEGGRLLALLADPSPKATLASEVEAMETGPGAVHVRPALHDWLREHERQAQAPATRFSEWAREAARFTYTPPNGARRPVRSPGSRDPGPRSWRP